MSAKPYTETFIRTYTSQAYVRWTCPAGHRAVLTSILATCNGGGVGNCLCWIAGIPVSRIGFQAVQATQAFQVRAVIYAHQELLVYLDSATVSATYSGYLFEDTSGAVGPPGTLEVLDLPFAEPMPV